MTAPKILVCGVEAGPQVPGSVPARCALCGRGVVVSPAGQPLLREGAYQPWCFPCAAGGEPAPVHTSPALTREIEGVLGPLGGEAGVRWLTQVLLSSGATGGGPR